MSSPWPLSIGRFAFMTFNVMTTDNDCNSIPSASMLEAELLDIIRICIYIYTTKVEIYPKRAFEPQLDVQLAVTELHALGLVLPIV